MTINVQEAALDFAQELQDLLNSVLPIPEGVSPDDRRVQLLFTDGRYAIRVAAGQGRIALTKDGKCVGYLRVSYQCTSDTTQTYLAVHKSAFELFDVSDRNPIARQEYERDAVTPPWRAIVLTPTAEAVG